MKINKLLYLIVVTTFITGCYNVLPPFNYYNKFYGSWKIKEYQQLNNQGEWITVFQDTGRFIFYHALEDMTQEDDANCRVFVFFVENFFNLKDSPNFSFLVDPSTTSWFGSFYWLVYDKSTLILRVKKEAANELNFNFEFKDKNNLILTAKYDNERWILTKIPDK